MKTLVTKSQFAALKHRAPSAVSNWIKGGKITGSALIGVGARAYVWVERADMDLAASLDPRQQACREYSALRSALFPHSPHGG